jgi:hypothetical protein
VSKGSLTLQLIWPGGTIPEVSVFDVSGRRVARLQGPSSDPGSYDLLWNLDNLAGKPVTSGVYLLRLSGGGRSRVTVVR